MKGNTLTEFIDDLLTMGGPEKEYVYKGNKYFLETQPCKQDSTLIELVVFECFGEENYIFQCQGKNYAECVEQFENAKIFDGRTIYEAEDDITVLYG